MLVSLFLVCVVVRIVTLDTTGFGMVANCSREVLKRHCGKYEYFAISRVVVLSATKYPLLGLFLITV